MVSLSCRRALFAAVVLFPCDVVVFAAGQRTLDELDVADDCVNGIELPDDFDGSDWPKMYRLDSPDPEDPMAENNKYNYDVSVNPSVLARAGVTYKYMDPAGYDYPNRTGVSPWIPSSNETANNDEELQQIREDEDYQYADIVAPSAFIPTYWEEHFHEASTIRYILDGSGYFDLRDVNNEWVRIYVTAGDFLEWPAGIQHRFTVDSEDGAPAFIQAMRLYKGSASPDWLAVYDAIPGNNTARDEYVSTYLCDINPDVDEINDDALEDGTPAAINNIPTPGASDADTDADSSTTASSDNVVDKGADAGLSTDNADADSGSTAATTGSLLLSFFTTVAVGTTTMLITMF